MVGWASTVVMVLVAVGNAVMKHCDCRDCLRRQTAMLKLDLLLGLKTAMLLKFIHSNNYKLCLSMTTRR